MKIRPAKLVRLILLCLAWAATFLWQPAQAASTSTTAASAAPVDQARLMRWLKSQPGMPHGRQIRVAVELKADTRKTRLIACEKSEFFLSRGARLRGRVNVGDRCVAGATWTRWHNAFVRVHGPALVSRRALPAGSAPQAADFRVEQVEWSALQHDPASVDTVLAGQQLIRALAADQPLRTDHLRPMPAIRSGEAVTAIADGEGFRIAVDATALSDASDGQPIRVRTASGKVLNGMVSGRTVTIGR
ncbi:MAG: flagellar basal body P-ring formation chaperone FlgA [Lautropia sp.]|nr:flagellar basal body P-ring formation chaperone FlgA [Lautropia sp.]